MSFSRVPFWHFSGPPEMRPLFGRAPKTCLKHAWKHNLNMRFPYFSPPDWSTTRQNGSQNVIPPETPYVCRISRFFWETPFWHFLEPHGTRLGGLRGACLGTFGARFPRFPGFPGHIESSLKSAKTGPEKCQNGPRKVSKRDPKSAKTGPKNVKTGPKMRKRAPKMWKRPDFEETAQILTKTGGKTGEENPASPDFPKSRQKSFESTARVRLRQTRAVLSFNIVLTSAAIGSMRGEFPLPVASPSLRISGNSYPRMSADFGKSTANFQPRPLPRGYGIWRLQLISGASWLWTAYGLVWPRVSMLGNLQGLPFRDDRFPDPETDSQKDGDCG